MCPRLADTELQYPPSPHRANAYNFITLTAHGNTHELRFLDVWVGGGGEGRFCSPAQQVLFLHLQVLHGLLSTNDVSAPTCQLCTTLLADVSAAANLQALQFEVVC